MPNVSRRGFLRLVVVVLRVSWLICWKSKRATTASAYRPVPTFALPTAGSARSSSSPSRSRRPRDLARRSDDDRAPSSVRRPRPVASAPRTRRGHRASALRCSDIVHSVVTSPSAATDVLQTSAFVVLYGGALATSTRGAVRAIDAASESVVGLETWRTVFVEFLLPTCLGLVRVVDAAFSSFSSSSSSWTYGVAEAAGGAGLLLDVLARRVVGDDDDDEEDGLSIDKLVAPLSASWLLVATTTAAVTSTTTFDASRFASQVALSSSLLVLAKDSFFFVWGDELD